MKKGILRLQEIEDFYKNRYSGDKLRKALEKDKEWKKLGKERREKLGKKIHLTKSERIKYVMSTDKDYEILSKIKRLERLKLTKEDRFLVKLMRTQLEHDWRRPLIQALNKILRKHQ